MQDLMKGKRGLVMGVANDHSIAWGIAKTLAAQGAELAFTYQGDALGKRVKPLAASLGVDMVLPCDVENLASVDEVFAALLEKWGRLDFLVHAIAFSDKNELKGRYADTTRENFSRKISNTASTLAMSSTSQGSTMSTPSCSASGLTRLPRASPWKVKASSAPLNHKPSYPIPRESGVPSTPWPLDSIAKSRSTGSPGQAGR